MNTPNADTLAFIAAHHDEDVLRVALQTHPSDVDMAYALAQIEGRQRMRHKVPSWATREEIVYPQHLPLEQCSSEATARYKASVMQTTGVHDRYADLTGGFGVDCYFMHDIFGRGTYVERQETLADIVKHNFRVLGADNVDVVNADSTEYLRSMEHVDWLYMDPARRNGSGNKVVSIADCEPDILALEPLLIERASHVMVKLSPMLDISMAVRQISHITDVHIVSVDNECKELLIVLNKDGNSTGGYVCHCINITNSGIQAYPFDSNDSSQPTPPYAQDIQKFLYEPNTSIMKAGCTGIASRFGVQKLHPNSHLYTSDKLIVEFPGRTFSVIDTVPFSKAPLKQMLAGLSQANITVRNFPASVAELRRRLHLRDGGDTYLFATTLSPDRRIIVRCSKL